MQASLAMQRGIPLGKPPVVELRNQHAQYAATWYVFSQLEPIPILTVTINESPLKCHHLFAASSLANIVLKTDAQVLIISRDICDASPITPSGKDRTQGRQAMAWIDTELVGKNTNAHTYSCFLLLVLVTAMTFDNMPRVFTYPLIPTHSTCTSTTALLSSYTRVLHIQDVRSSRCNTSNRRSVSTLLPASSFSSINKKNS